ncbi:MAG: hypothetical protein JWO38_8216 [Gemmataceae bacterium]|nr:hypothetical protein [Gemmataceae bacterium]
MCSPARRVYRVTVSGRTPVNRAVFRVPPHGHMDQDSRYRVRWQSGVEQGCPLPLGEPGRAGRAPEEMDLVRPVLHRHRQIPVPALAEVRVVRVETDEVSRIGTGRRV